ncbi:MAG TPA: hypothetical protein VFE37_16175 [Chloroflexota bacterium]|nr:hypothetical protein [Chloroflexota bacterium]
MRDRHPLTHARDRFVVTAALLERLHEQLRAGRLRPAQAGAACALVAAQLDQALSSLEAAQDCLWSAPLSPGRNGQRAAAAPLLGEAPGPLSQAASRPV